MINRCITAVALLVLMTGCRMYGGYGSEASSLEQIQQLRTWAQQEKESGVRDQAALETASVSMPMLEDYRERLNDLSVTLTALSGRWADRAGEVDGSSSYREIHRVLGSMISERQRYLDRYRRLADDLASELSGFGAESRAEARYQVVPVYYARLQAGFRNVRIHELVVGL